MRQKEDLVNADTLINRGQNRGMIGQDGLEVRLLELEGAGCLYSLALISNISRVSTQDIGKNVCFLTQYSQF
jgi:hypothetical protein